MKTLILTLLISVNSAIAAPMAQVKNLNLNGLATPYLVGDSPQEITDVMKGLFAVSSMTDPGVPSPRLESIECLDKSHPVAQAAGALCIGPAYPFLPAAFRDLMNQDMPADGPNCWNASLVTAGLLGEIRFSDGAEFSSYMNSNLCAKVIDRNGVQAGDIIAIRNHTEGEVHGMVYVSRDHVFSKNGSLRVNQYVVMPHDSIYEFYGVDREECRFQAETPTQLACPNAWANVYRCKK